MKKASFLVTIGLTLGKMGSAHEMGGPFEPMTFILPGVVDSRPIPKEGPCAELKLDKEQKAKLKAAFYKFEENKIDLEAQVKKSHLEYEKLLTNADASATTAKEVSQGIVSSKTSLLQAEQNYRNEIFFEILKPEQRGTAQACEHMMMRRGFEKFHDKKWEPGQDKKPH
jgi:Spy/CpxP family protein refolding chaperone